MQHGSLALVSRKEGPAVCQQALSGSETVLGTSDLAQIRPAGCTKSWNPEMHWLAHVSPYVFDAVANRGH